MIVNDSYKYAIVTLVVYKIYFYYLKITVYIYYNYFLKV